MGTYTSNPKIRLLQVYVPPGLRSPVRDKMFELNRGETRPAYLSFGRRNPLSSPPLPLLLGALDLLSGLLVDPDDVVVGEDLAVDHGLLGECLPLLELGPHPALLFRPLLLSRLIFLGKTKCEETLFRVIFWLYSYYNRARKLGNTFGFCISALYMKSIKKIAAVCLAQGGRKHNSCYEYIFGDTERVK